MTEHTLKSWPEFFEPIARGMKAFELRRDDRDYQVGDILVLQEWKPEPPFHAKGSYTGRECRRRVTFVLNGLGNVGVVEPIKGLLRGYCILSLAEIE
jgi:hypothetical protein